MCLVHSHSSEVSLREDLESEGSEHLAPAVGGLSIITGSAVPDKIPQDPLGSVVALARTMVSSCHHIHLDERYLYRTSGKCRL